MGLTARLRTHFNVQHMMAAAYFSRQALHIESTYSPRLDDGEPYFAHRGYVTGAVLSVAASLEATINELYIDAKEGITHTFEGGDPKIPRLLARADWEKLEKDRILDRYQEALTSTGKQQFVRGRKPYQSVDDLIRLRSDQ